MCISILFSMPFYDFFVTTVFYITKYTTLIPSLAWIIISRHAGTCVAPLCNLLWYCGFCSRGYDYCHYCSPVFTYVQILFPMKGDYFHHARMSISRDIGIFMDPSYKQAGLVSLFRIFDVRISITYHIGFGPWLFLYKCGFIEKITYRPARRFGLLLIRDGKQGSWYLLENGVGSWIWFN